MRAAAAKAKDKAAAEGRLQPISSYARIKPLDAEPGGGVASKKHIAGWDEEGGSVTVAGSNQGGKGGGGNVVFEHPHAVLSPDATQENVYATIAQPLVRRFLDGFDADLILYGQTGSGKTYTMFGPPHSMERAAEALGSDGGTDSGGVLRTEHGIFLRSALDALEAVAARNAVRRGSAVLHGSLLELSIASFTDQTISDLTNGGAPCFVDESHHVQGARQIPLVCASDAVRLAAFVETRLTGATKMNCTSSRSHCVAILTLSAADECGGDARLRESRLQFFDLMGSERFVGNNAAHDTSKSSKASKGGWEGIYANLSLSGLMGAVDAAAKVRRARRGGKPDKSMGSFCHTAAAALFLSMAAHAALYSICCSVPKQVDMLLTKLLAGSLTGAALTAMITCLSQSPRNGDESYLSLKYGGGMAKLLNAPALQPAVSLARLLANARKQHEVSAAIVARGVKGKFQARREAEVAAAAHTVATLEAFAAGRGAAEYDGAGAL